jgi:mono/diheme cytochrome c family protein
MSAALVALLAGCAGRYGGEPIAGPLALSPQETRGRVVYAELCQQCHPGGEAGLGPSVVGNPVPVWLQRQQVRLGAGAMPAFGREEIARDDLKAIAAYIRALKRHQRE